MNGRFNRDSAIAAAVTMVAALAILLLLFCGSLKFDRAALASSSIPEIQNDEELFIEPELLTPADIGAPEEKATDQEAAPPPPGEPDPAEKEQQEVKIPAPAPKKTEQKKTQPKEELVASKKPSDVKTRKPELSDEERKRVESMQGKFKSDNNGSRKGRDADHAGVGTSGVGTQGNVAGRKMLSCPSSKVRVSQKSVVRVNITVNAEGAVTSAKAVSGGTPNLRSTCEGWARRSRWTPREGAAPAKGTITFTVIPG